MATDKQIAANRENALKSTGPRTPQGKRRSSMNALKHGCASKRVIVPGEDPDDYEELLDSLWLTYSPRDGIEEVLVHQLTNLSWRIRRVEHGEAMLGWYRFNCVDIDRHLQRKLAAPPQDKEELNQYRLGRSLQDLTDSDGNSYTSLSRYSASLYRAHSQALRDLETRRRMNRIQPEEDARGLEAELDETPAVNDTVDGTIEATDPPPSPKPPAIETKPETSILQHEPSSDATPLDRTG